MADLEVERSPTGEIVDQTGKGEEKGEAVEKEVEKSTEKPDDKKTDGKTLLTKSDDKAEAKPAAGAPEKYEFKLPEGYELDEKVSGEATKLFKDLGIPAEGAQRLVDFYLAQTEAAAQAPIDFWTNQRAEWVKEIKADTEIGGKLDVVKSTIGKAIDSLGPDLATSFREAMDYTGVGDNPAFVKAFYKFAQQLTEGGHVSGRGPTKEGQREPGKGPPTAAHALYPNLP